jgi:DNA-directed RNA polymerase subunit M/transcription elongation factor TFIIS
VTPKTGKDPDARKAFSMISLPRPRLALDDISLTEGAASSAAASCVTDLPVAELRIASDRLEIQRDEVVAPVARRRSSGRRRGRSVPPQRPLGSLTQKADRPLVTCGVCGSHHVTRLNLQLTDGTPVQFTSCHRCEHRSWQHIDGELTVAGVLDRTRKY